MKKFFAKLFPKLLPKSAMSATSDRVAEIANAVASNIESKSGKIDVRELCRQRVIQFRQRREQEAEARRAALVAHRTRRRFPGVAEQKASEPYRSASGRTYVDLENGQRVRIFRPAHKHSTRTGLRSEPLRDVVQASVDAFNQKAAA